MNDETFHTLEQLFLALSDKTRLKLLGLMAAGEVSVGYLADSLGLSQPMISRHLAYLRNAGLVSTRRDGKWIFYTIEYPSAAAARHVLTETLGTVRAGPQAKRDVPDMPTPFEPEYVRQELEIHLL